MMKMLAVMVQTSTLVPEFFKVGAKVEIPVYDEVVDPEKLDSWLDQFDTYFTLQRFSNAQKVAYTPLKMTGHAKTWWKAITKTREVDGLIWSQFKRLYERNFILWGT